jgi:hypothetical protein
MIKLHYFFSMRKTLWLLMGLLLFIMGCPGGDSTDDETDSLNDLQFNYHQGLNTLYYSVQVESSFLGKKLQAVHALYFGFDTTRTADTLVLNDWGIAGDIISDDGVFSIRVSNDSNNITFILEPTDTGNVYTKFLAQYGTSIKSKMLVYETGNQGPKILSVSMPDSLRRPGTDSVSVGHSSLRLQILMAMKMCKRVT